MFYFRTMNELDCIEKLKEMVTQNGSQKAVAVKIGIAQSYLSDIFLGRRPVGPKILRYFGLKREVRLIIVDFDSVESRAPEISRCGILSMRSQ